MCDQDSAQPPGPAPPPVRPANPSIRWPQQLPVASRSPLEDNSCRLCQQPPREHPNNDEITGSGGARRPRPVLHSCCAPRAWGEAFAAWISIRAVFAFKETAAPQLSTARQSQSTSTNSRAGVTRTGSEVTDTDDPSSAEHSLRKSHTSAPAANPATVPPRKSDHSTSLTTPSLRTRHEFTSPETVQPPHSPPATQEETVRSPAAPADR